MENELDLSRLGISQDLLPAELTSERLGLLDEMLARQEEKQSRRLYDSQEERGFFRSGDTQRRLTEEILGPSIERRQSALMDWLSDAIGQQTAHRRQIERDKLDFDRRLDLIQHELNAKRDLLAFQGQLELGKPKAGFFDHFLPEFAGALGRGFAQGGGQAAGKGISSGMAGLVTRML